MKMKQVYAFQVQMFAGLLVLLVVVLMQQRVIIASDQRQIEVYSLIACLQFFLSVYLWYIVHSEIVCPYSAWQLAAFLFLASQSMFWMFGTDAGILDLIHNPNYGYNNNDIKAGLLITIFSFIAMSSGALISEGVKKYNNWRKIRNTDIRNAAIFLLLISIIPFAIKNYNNLSLIKQMGYKALYYENTKYGISASLNYIALFIDPGIVLFLLYLLYSKKRNIVFLILITTKIILELIIGGRSSVVMFFMGWICAYSYIVKKISGRRVFILLLASLIAFQLLYAVSITRLAANKAIAFKDTLFNLKIDFVRQFIGQMGWSMTPVLQVAKRIPNEISIRYGESYLFSFLSLIPNLGLWKIHPTAIKSGLAEWLQGIMGIDYGPGFSFIAELFLNYHYLYFIGAFMWGGFWGRIFSSVDEENAKTNKHATVFVILLLSITTKHFIRSSFLSFFKTTVYYVLFPMFVLWVVSSSRKYREYKKRK